MTRVSKLLLSAVLSLLLMTCTADASRESKAEELLSHHHDMSMSMAGKGKGMTDLPTPGKAKGRKGGDDEYMSMYLSMDMSMSMAGKPKGTKGKMSKKSSKSSKSSKKGGVDGVDDGGEAGGDEPTMAPAGATITSSPTSENSIPIRATPFALFYDGDFSRIPNDDEFASVAELTRIYLEELMFAEFEQTSLTNIDDFLTFMIRNQFLSGRPVQADYRCTGLFNPSSIFLPTVRELNSLIDAAFVDENLDEYVSRIQGLPSGNIFSTTTGVMKGLPATPVPRTAGAGSGEGTSSMKMGLAAAAAGIVVLAAGAALIKRKQRHDGRLEDPYSDNLKGDSATLAGETCNTSIDGSAAWRKTSPYVTSHDVDESELEEEPLDDNEGRGSPSQAARPATGAARAMAYQS